MIADELATLFLSKTQLQKLIILKELESGMATFDNLEKQLEISKRKEKESTTSLLEEIQTYESQQPITLVIDKEIIQFENKPRDADYAQLINDFRYKYLTESRLYKVLLFVLEKGYSVL